MAAVFKGQQPIADSVMDKVPEFIDKRLAELPLEGPCRCPLKSKDPHLKGGLVVGATSQPIPFP
jgi:hypothetical protein